jgi:hypothetical protein
MTILLLCDDPPQVENMVVSVQSRSSAGSRVGVANERVWSVGGRGDLRAGSRAGGRCVARVVGAAGGAGRSTCEAGGACRGARAAAEARLAHFVAAAEPGSALDWETGTVAGDGASAWRPTRARWPRAVVVSDGAVDGGRRALAGAVRLWPRLWRGRADAERCAGAAPGGGVAAACGRDQRASSATRLLSRLWSHGSRRAAGRRPSWLFRPEAGGGDCRLDGPQSSLAPPAGGVDGGVVWLPDRGRDGRRDPHSHRRDIGAGLRGVARADAGGRRAQHRRDRLVPRRGAAHALGCFQQADGGAADRA